MKKFPHVEQFINIVNTIKYRHDYAGNDDNEEAIFKHVSDYPTLSFTGTVKLDGTNCAIGFENSAVYFQSRTRQITIGDDNYGFVNWASKEIKNNQNIIKILFKNEDSIIFGEWCGNGIQKKTAVSQLSKRYVLFDKCICVNGEFSRVTLKFNEDELKALNDSNIWHIDQFDRFHVNIDFNNAKIAAEEMTIYVNAVENECPVANAFGIDDGIGEGIVWKCDDSPFESKLWFKTKGEKHKHVKIKKIEIDPIKFKSISNFVEFALSDERLDQAIIHVKDKNGFLDNRCISEYLKWLNTDIARECREELKANDITMKDVSKQISKIAKAHFAESINVEL